MSLVLRRYTPPTCTLEIVATGSPLSRWAGRPLLKQLKFHLHFDDPRLPDEQQVSLHGNHTQLEVLRSAVQVYVEEFLGGDWTTAMDGRSPLSERSLSSHADLTTPSPRSMAPPVFPAPAAIDTPQYLTPGSLVANDSQALLEESQHQYPHPYTTEGNLATLEPETTLEQGDEIYLQPRGLLSHTLFLGSLAHEVSGPVIQLSTLQLADLLAALDEYEADLDVLPTLARPAWVQAPPTWLRTAAIVLVSVGLTATVMKLLELQNQMIQTAANNEAEQVAVNSAPITAPTLGVPNAPLSSKQGLPPPPPPGAVTSSPAGALPAVVVPPTAPFDPDAVPPPITTIPAPPASLPPPPPTTSQAQAPVGNQTTLAIPPAPVAPPAPQLERSALPPLAESNARRSAGQSNADLAAGTAFDTIPQVAEAREYFQQRWQPLPQLTQTLEYSLVLGPDGSIQQISPLGKAAGDYIDRTGMPLTGEPFVSAPPRPNPVIRVVLSPNGKVQTFLER